MVRSFRFPVHVGVRRIHTARLLLTVVCVCIVLAETADAQRIRNRIAAALSVPPPGYLGAIGVGRGYVILPRRRATLYPDPYDPYAPQPGPPPRRLEPQPEDSQRHSHEVRKAGPAAEQSKDLHADQRGVYGGGRTPTPASRPANSEPSFPDHSQLQGMDDVQLLNSLARASYNLHERLGLFTTGAGWQRHLRLPEAVLPSASSAGQVHLKISALQDTLERFDRVAENQDYAKITSLASFGATHDALSLAVTRFRRRLGTRTAAGQTVSAASAQGSSPERDASIPSSPTKPAGPRLTPATPPNEGGIQTETLPRPTPDPAPVEADPGVERSVLTRTTRD